jgi:hypothetical protein
LRGSLVQNLRCSHQDKPIEDIARHRVGT